MRGQSPEVQEQRLKNGCCPVHGLGMSGISYELLGCPRRDCQIAWLASSVTHDKYNVIDRHTERGGFRIQIAPKELAENLATGRADYRTIGLTGKQMSDPVNQDFALVA